MKEPTSPVLPELSITAPAAGTTVVREFARRFFEATIRPDAFFERVRHETSWKMPLLHLLVLALWLSAGSVIAWGLGVSGDTPVNSALGAQMDIYPYWRDTLYPSYGMLSYTLSAGLIALEMAIITIIYTPLLFIIFRYLGGAKEPHGLLHAFQGFVYGLTPAAFGGFLPILGLLLGVYTTILQLYRGPAITLQNRSVAAYIPVVAVLAYAIARYWSHALL